MSHSKHDVVFRNGVVSIRVERPSKSSAHVIMEGPPAGTTVRASDLSGEQLVKIGKQLVKIGKSLSGIPKEEVPARLRELTPSDVAFNQATEDCEAWCKVNLKQDLKGDKARKAVVDDNGKRLFPHIFESILMDITQKDFEARSAPDGDESPGESDAPPASEPVD